MIESENAGMTGGIGGTQTEQPGFVHSALLYHSQREYLDFVVRFVVDGLARDEAALVAVPSDKLALLHNALDGAGGGFPAEVRLADIAGLAPTRAGLWQWRVPSPTTTPIDGCGL